MQLLRLSGWIACLPLALVLASCAGGSAPSAATAGAKAANPGSPGAIAAAGVVPASFTFVIPLPSSHAATRSRKPQYLPATAQSLEIAIVLVNGSAPSPTPSPTISNVGSTEPGCTTGAGSTYTCTVVAGLPIGSDEVLVKAFDAPNMTGNLLSQQQSTFTVAQGSANSFSMTLDANPGPIVLTQSGSACIGSPITSCTVATGSSALSFTATVADAHGTPLANNTIAGSPSLSVTSSNTAAATVTAAQAPYGITLTPVASGTTTITLSASPATGTSALSPTSLQFNVTVAAPPTLSVPAGVALDSAGNLYVVSVGTNSVEIFNSTGAASSIAGGSITGLNGPWGVAVDSAGNIYVANRTGNNVNIFTNTGAVSPIAGGTISGLSSPFGVAVDSAGNIYVANFSAHNVKIFTSTGAASPIAGGTITTGLSTPCGVALDSAGNIYVADCSAYAIKIYTNSTTPGGVLSTTIGVGTTGTIPQSAGVSDPIGLAVDGAGNIYVGNYGGGLDNVNVFTSAGVLSDTITTGVRNPGGVAVASGNIYVGNLGNNTVTVYNASTGALTNTIH